MPVLPAVTFQSLMLMGTSAGANQVSPTTCMSQGPIFLHTALGYPVLSPGVGVGGISVLLSLSTSTAFRLIPKPHKPLRDRPFIVCLKVFPLVRQDGSVGKNAYNQA